MAHSGRSVELALVQDLSTADVAKVAGRVVVISGLLLGWVAWVAVGFSWLLLLLTPVVGFVLSGFINAAHDCVHRGHLPSATANRVAGALWATPIFLNFSIYRHQHLMHHRRTGIEGDTEPEVVFLNLGEYLHSLSAVAFWPSVLRRMVRTVRGSFPATVAKAEHQRAARQDNALLMSWLALAAVATVLFPLQMVVGYWVPLACAFAWITWFSLPEHYGLWGVPDVERNTRTVLASSLTRFFQWNGNYHAEHHRHPAVASVNLHTLHRVAPPHPVQEPSYLAFHVRLVRSLARRDLSMNDVHGLKAAAAGEPEGPCGSEAPATVRGAIA